MTCSLNYSSAFLKIISITEENFNVYKKSSEPPPPSKYNVLFLEKLFRLGLGRTEFRSLPC